MVIPADNVTVDGGQVHRAQTGKRGSCTKLRSSRSVRPILSICRCRESNSGMAPKVCSRAGVAIHGLIGLGLTWIRLR